MVKYILLIFIMSLSGCSLIQSERIIYKTKTVNIPVEILKCPIVDLRPRPSLDIQNIDKDSSLSEVFGAYPASIFQLQDYSLYLEKIIESQNGIQTIK